MENNFLLFCNVDEEGNIIEGVTGNNIIPDKQYDFFFYLGEEGVEDLLLYKIINNELVKNAE